MLMNLCPYKFALLNFFYTVVILWNFYMGWMIIRLEKPCCVYLGILHCFTVDTNSPLKQITNIDTEWCCLQWWNYFSSVKSKLFWHNPKLRFLRTGFCGCSDSVAAEHQQIKCCWRKSLTLVFLLIFFILASFYVKKYWSLLWQEID